MAENRINLVDSGVLTLEKQASEKVHIAWCDAYKNEDGITVTGVLRRRDLISSPIEKRVDVTILLPEGTVLDDARSADCYIPREIIGRVERLQRVTMSFPNVPFQSAVCIIACNGQHHDRV